MRLPLLPVVLLCGLWGTPCVADVLGTTYGMVCDGVSDDSAGLTATLAAVNSERTVVLPGGECVLTGSFTLPTNSVIRGQGRSATILHLRTGSLLLPTGSDRVTVEDLTIRITSMAQVAVSITGSGEHVFRDVIITSTGDQVGTGLSSTDAGASGVYGVHLDSVQFEDLYYGLVLGSGSDRAGSNAWTLTGVKFSSNLYGLWLADATAIEIDGGWFEANNLGLSASSGQNLCQKVSVRGTYFENSWNVNIPANCSQWMFDNVTLVDWRVTDNSRNSLYVGTP